MKWLFGIVGVLLVAIGVISLAQPGYAPGRPLPGGASGFSASPPPAVSVSSGLYFKTYINARGTGGVMYLRCYVYDVYLSGAWIYEGSGGSSFGDGVVTVGPGPFKFGGEVNLSAPLMGGCVPLATPAVDGLVLGGFKVAAPGARLAADLEGLYVSFAGGLLSHIVSYIGEGAAPGRPNDRHLYVPPDLKPALEGIVANITAGCGDARCVAARIKAFLASGFIYDGTLDAVWPEIPQGVDPVLWFLKEGKRGVCIHFASAFVLLARAAGVPARLVIGYVSDGPVPTGWALTAFSPHAWAEYYVEGVGWVGVEATPGGAAQAPLGAVQLPLDAPPETPAAAAPAGPPAPPLEIPSWILAAVAAFVAIPIVLTARRRYITLGVGEEFVVGGPAGFAVYVNKRLVGKAPARLVFDKPGFYVVRAGPLVYLVRVLDYKRLAGSLYRRVLKRLGLPPTVTPRELASLRPEYGEVALLFERIRFGPRASREDVERLRRAL